MLDLLFDINWLSILPYLLAVVGGAFGFYQKGNATKSKAEAANSKMQAKSEKVRGDIAMDTAVTVIKQQEANQKELNDKLKAARIKRTHFNT